MTCFPFQVVSQDVIFSQKGTHPSRDIPYPSLSLLRILVDLSLLKMTHFLIQRYLFLSFLHHPPKILNHLPIWGYPQDKWITLIFSRLPLLPTKSIHFLKIANHISSPFQCHFLSSLSPVNWTYLLVLPLILNLKTILKLSNTNVAKMLYRNIFFSC